MPRLRAALGNILLQALAMGRIKDRDEANLINQQSFKRPLIFPNPTTTWAPTYERLCQIRATEATPVSA